MIYIVILALIRKMSVWVEKCMLVQELPIKVISLFKNDIDGMRNYKGNNMWAL